MTAIDHLVYTTPGLKNGMDEIEALLGIRPVPGGRHPDFGTHNALLSLGPTTYLEVIAPDPELPVVDRGLPFGMSHHQESKIATWASCSESIENLADAALRAGLDIGKVELGSRLKQDGSLLTWKLTNPNAMLLDGAIPFLISWGKTPHPAVDLPRAGELTGFRIEHPQPDRVRHALAIMGVKTNVQEATGVKIVALIKTVRGIMELS
jgi:glyoxalase-like protein